MLQSRNAILLVACVEECDPLLFRIIAYICYIEIEYFMPVISVCIFFE